MKNNIWDINEKEFPSKSSIEEKIKFWLNYAILAPSAHNNQPWRCKILDNKLEIYLDLKYTPWTGTMRQTLFSIGAFIENLQQAANHFGYSSTMEAPLLIDKKSVIASLTFEQRNGKSEEIDLFEGITKRHTNRGLYKEESPEKIIELIKDLPKHKDVFLSTVSDIETKKKIGSIIRKGVKIALSMAPLKKELSHFVCYLSEKSGTGIPVEAMIKDPEKCSTGAEWVMQKMDPEYEAVFSEEKYSKTPVIIVISTRIDTPIIWLETGRYTQKIFLQVAKQGMTHCVTAAPIEIPVLSPLLRKTSKSEGKPQMLFRVGTPLDPSFTIHSPRRESNTILDK